MSHNTKSSCSDPWLHGLPAPVKNHFFYGMLLTDEVLRKDQRYFDGKRWLLNRLAVGQGVLAGLDFEVSADDARCNGTQGKRWRIHLNDGVAVDGFGREIIVPEGTRKDDQSRWPGAMIEVSASNECGEVKAHEVNEFLNCLGIQSPPVPAGVQAAPARALPVHPVVEVYTLALQIAYRSVPTDPVPVKAGHCSRDCEPSSTREEFQLRVVKLDDGDPRHQYLVGNDAKYSSGFEEEFSRSDGPKWPSHGNLADVFPPEAQEDVRHRGNAQDNEHLVSSVIPECHSEWVTLGLLKLNVTRNGLETSSLRFKKLGRYYRQVFSNDALSKLIFGLADRVDEASRVRVLTFDGLNGASGEAQSANVYQPLLQPLKVKVINSNSEHPANHDSISVRFEVLSPDSGILSTNPFDPAAAYDPGTGSSWLEVEVKSDGTLTQDVHWRMHKTPGLHTVSARIIPKNAADPPFHPGSQLTFHTTAKPTAPTIVGIEFDDPWWLDEKCRKFVWTDSGELTLRLLFSRRIGQAGIEQLARYFKVWAICRHHHHGVVVTPRLLNLIPGHCTQVCPTNPPSHESADEIWQVECRLTGLFTHLCPGDALRLVLLGRVGGHSTLRSISSELYPTPQLLDLSCDGSYLSKDYRNRLWGDSPYFDPGHDDDTAVAHNQPDLHQQGNARPGHVHISKHVEHSMRRFWDRFRPREACLPTGDGTEGGEFHKTFEFRLPCGC